MKKSILITAIVGLFSSCENRKSVSEKPFIITYKGSIGSIWVYDYQDKNGKLGSFEDYNKYSVGDTIK